VSAQRAECPRSAQKARARAHYQIHNNTTVASGTATPRPTRATRPPRARAPRPPPPAAGPQHSGAAWPARHTYAHARHVERYVAYNVFT
jgi:hypothetical protein